MSWSDLNAYPSAVESMQRSLQRGRLAHGYLLQGQQLESLERFARTLAKALNCAEVQQGGENAFGLDSCDRCLSCRKIEQGTHPDVIWMRAESKSRQIRGEQMTDLLQTLYLKPNEARWKVSCIVAADRLNPTAANKFLKTLEEPPARSILLLLTTQPEQVLETLRSRCQRITLFESEGAPRGGEAESQWLKAFGEAAAQDAGGLLERYRLLSVLLRRLAEMRGQIEEKLQQESPLETASDLEPELRKKLEGELEAAIEAEYRRQRSEVLGTLQWWLRDVWLQTLQQDASLFHYPQFRSSTSLIAQRLRPEEAMNNLEEFDRTQRLLTTNVQEALALEVGLLKLRL